MLMVVDIKNNVKINKCLKYQKTIKRCHLKFWSDSEWKVGSTTGLIRAYGSW